MPPVGPTLSDSLIRGRAFLFGGRNSGIFGTSLPVDLATLRRDYTVEAIAKVDTTDRRFFKEESLTDLRRLALHTIVLVSDRGTGPGCVLSSIGWHGRQTPTRDRLV